MRFQTISVLLLLLTPATLVTAQTTGHSEPVPRVEIGLNYTYLHANAPPSGCGCFSLNGGSGTVLVNARRGWSAVADLNAAEAGNINATGQNITVFHYLFGPRWSYRSSSRFTPFGQVLVGGARETSNYISPQTVSAFGAGVGGGVTAALGRRIGWNIVQVDWIFTTLPNAQNNRQNDLRVGTGIVFRF
jgi:outer membrane immunogenic protein